MKIFMKHLVRTCCVALAIAMGCVVVHELGHDRFESFFTHLAVSNADTRFRTDLLHEIRQGIDRFDSVMNNVDLPTLGRPTIAIVGSDKAVELEAATLITESSSSRIAVSAVRPNPRRSEC